MAACVASGKLSNHGHPWRVTNGPFPMLMAGYAVVLSNAKDLHVQFAPLEVPALAVLRAITASCYRNWVTVH